MTKDNQQQREQFDSDGLLKIPQVAKKLGVTTSWIRSSIFKGSIPYYKIGRLVRFKTSELDAWIESTKKEVQS